MNTVSTIINDHFGWVFRRTHQEHDFGVDGYIDYVTKEGSVTGQFLAVQIKTGKSYLSKSGGVHWYSDTKEHLNYFLNLPTFIILVICDPESDECFWAQLDIEEVDYRGETWRFPIPKSQRLSKESIPQIEKILGIPEDYVTEFEEDEQFLSLIGSDTYVQYAVPRHDIESLKTDKLKTFLKRITRNEKLTRAVQGRLYICTYGYEHDSREVFEIKDVRKWAKKARRKIHCWYLCANDRSIPSTLIWVAASSCRVDAKLDRRSDGSRGFRLSGISEEWTEFLEECFHGLNKDSEKWGWSTQMNKEISELISKELCPSMPEPESDQ
ncbi:DUF4365 domain-containing protein [Thioalkalivibrio sp. ALgr1]|uniref:DUF4365 domain-containing protein n=1 Tax=Thioalkalivibrio sp. ALgr1 TaxID=748655 RepID=UPI001E2FB855|nr:DUF4365 domain-containing protein [Thioalkalivibrio sp. ALgr1]